MRKRIVVFIFAFLLIVCVSGYATGLELEVVLAERLTITVSSEKTENEKSTAYPAHKGGNIVIDVEPELLEEPDIPVDGPEVVTESIDTVAAEDSENEKIVSEESVVSAVSAEKSSSILIYHTHTKEAYAQTAEDAYVECGAYRTADMGYNISAVGDVICENLTENGFSVIHNTTDNEAEVFSQSYDRSLDVMKQESLQNPDVNVYIDVHRDSIDDIEYARNDIITDNGTEYAKVLFVIGRGDDFEGDEKPDWESNLALAEQVSARLNELIPGISKGVMVKKGRYNQHLDGKSLLIEVGYDANTLVQAKNTAAIVGSALSDILE